MTTLYTSNQQLPYPDHNEYMKYGWQQIRDIGLAIEPKLVMKFTNSTDLTARVPTPTAGMFAYMADSQTLILYNGTTWNRVYPPSPAIYSGTTAPSSGLGTIGDIYIQHA